VQYVENQLALFPTYITLDFCPALKVTHICLRHFVAIPLLTFTTLPETITQFHYPVFAFGYNVSNPHIKKILFPKYNNVDFSMKKYVILLKAEVSHIKIASCSTFPSRGPSFLVAVHPAAQTQSPRTPGYTLRPHFSFISG
jgi:hypothetical protein